MSLPERDSNGKLPAFAWPGGYPLYYLTKDNCVLCAMCATASLNDDIPSFRACAYGVHWEGEAMHCEDCNAEIESAYGPVEED